jgi:hypothetical protein
VRACGKIGFIGAHPVIAQAMVEKGMLDGAVAGIHNALATVGHAIEAKPYLLIVLAVVLFLLLKKRR